MNVLADGERTRKHQHAVGQTKGFPGGRDGSLPIAAGMKDAGGVFSGEKQSAILHLVVLPEFPVSAGLLPDTLGLCHQQISTGAGVLSNTGILFSVPFFKTCSLSSSLVITLG